jgi:hypothetical protein
MGVGIHKFSGHDMFSVSGGSLPSIGYLITGTDGVCLGWFSPPCSVYGVRRSTGLQSIGGQCHYSESLGYRTILDGIVAWRQIFLGSDRQP